MDHGAPQKVLMRFSGLAFGFSSLSSTFEISFLIRVLAPQGGGVQ